MNEGRLMGGNCFPPLDCPRSPEFGSNCEQTSVQKTSHLAVGRSRGTTVLRLAEESIKTIREEDPGVLRTGCRNVRAAGNNL